MTARMKTGTGVAAMMTLALGLWAGTPPRAVAAPATTAAPPTAVTGSTVQGGPVDQVEQHITELHDKLQITSQQASQWKTFTDVMRENAEDLQSAFEKHQKEAADGQTAVDILKHYKAMADIHDASLKKLVPAFEKLYASLSPDQKKAADTLFQDREEARQERHAGGSPQTTPSTAPAK